MKPLVLMDIDGVVNAWPDRGDEEWALTISGMRVYVSNETLAALKKVFRGAHEVLWCTAWRDQANEFIPLLRNEKITEELELDYITDGRTLATGGFNTKWKFPAVKGNEKVQAAIAEGRPVYWFEDFEWGSWEARSAVKFCTLAEFGIKGVDTAAEGKLLLRHLEGTPFQ